MCSHSGSFQDILHSAFADIVYIRLRLWEETDDIKNNSEQACMFLPATHASKHNHKQHTQLYSFLQFT